MEYVYIFAHPLIVKYAILYLLEYIPRRLVKSLRNQRKWVNQLVERRVPHHLLALKGEIRTSSTFLPVFALASRKSNPCSLAHSSASSRGTCRRLSSFSHISTLLASRTHVRFGSACSRTSESHVRAFVKPVFKPLECEQYKDERVDDAIEERTWPGSHIKHEKCTSGAAVV